MTHRNRELLLLLFVGIIVAAAYGTAFIARSKVVDAAGLAWGGVFLALMLGTHMVVRWRLPHADPWILPTAAMLTGLGITMVFRLRPDLAGRQTAWLVIALAMLVALLIFLHDHRTLERYKYVIGAASVLVLIITVSPLGSTINGSKLWIKIGPMQIQPGEFAKLGIVIFLAAYLRENRELLAQKFSPKHLGPLVLFWGASLALLVLMNDFGTSLLFYSSFLLLIYAATGRAIYSVLGIAAFGAGAAFVYSSAAHVQQRFDIWLDPWQDPQVSGYQLIQGLFALSDGGLFGRGIGQAYLVTSDAKTLIPDAQTDFIFAAIGNELGFVGAVGVLLLFVVMTWRGFAIATRCHDGFSKLLAFGLATTFALQAFIIVGGVVRLLPLTGQTLPFVSYGGSSLLANWLLIGLLMIISNHAERTHVRDVRRAELAGMGGEL